MKGVLVTDLDGTLIQDERGYEAFTLEDYLDGERLLRCPPIQNVQAYVKKAKQDGRRVVVLTGRCKALRPYVEGVLSNIGVDADRIYLPNQFPGLTELGWWKAGVLEVLKEGSVEIEYLGDMDLDETAAQLAGVKFRYPNQV